MNTVWPGTIQNYFRSNLQSRKTFASARKMRACSGCWQFTVFRFRNLR